MPSYFYTGHFYTGFFAGLFYRIIGGTPATRPFLRGLYESAADVASISAPARLPAPAASGPSQAAVRQPDPSIRAKGVL